MNRKDQVIVIGGGLAGLTSAIHLAGQGIYVQLFEKNTYPTHKVCGEYISNEILPYWNTLGIDVNILHPTQLDEVQISTKKGNILHSTLPLGGFGVSRYSLDHHLYELAKASGVVIIQDQVLDVRFDTNKFLVTTKSNGLFNAAYVIGAHGKRSGLDKTLGRPFIQRKSPWLAVKAHYSGIFPDNLVALHNFEGGYCGISKIEDDKINVCYLVNFESFKKYQNLNDFQDQVLCANPHIREFFEQAHCLFDQPLSISQISFDRKSLLHNHIFLVGDAAGMIHPLCGNGMAMAIQSAQLLCQILVNSFKGETQTSEAIESAYKKAWKHQFSKRLAAGRILQSIVLNPYLQEFGYAIGASFPATIPGIIKQTHGKAILC
ncbi:NAD(P)/FAD-dependent oxidoreductase [Aquimarina intermedia]|nr:NAD(P)/FAD-dependent oxidoreductase [Aquimarina intermedia]